MRVLFDRAKREPARRGEWIRLAYAVDAPAADGAAEAFLADADEATAFWAAALLLRHGKGEAGKRGREAVLAALEKGDAHHRIDVVLDDLLIARDERVDALLGRYLAATRDAAHMPTSLLVQRALLLGRQDALDRLVEGLEGRGALPLGSYDGEGTIERWGSGDVDSPDALAYAVTRWLAPPRAWTPRKEEDDATRTKAREDAVALVKSAFAAVKAGTVPKVDLVERPIPLGRWAWVSSGWVLRTR